MTPSRPRRHAGSRPPARGTPRRPRSWLDDPPRRAALEASARRELPDLRYRHRQHGRGPVDSWAATVYPGHYEPRLVTVQFERASWWRPRVFSDGPCDRESSPHRYPDSGRRRLCMWYPTDPPNRRWSVDDGLLALFAIAADHLFKEAWWRETGEWLGEEAPHDDDITDEPTPPQEPV